MLERLFFHQTPCIYLPKSCGGAKPLVLTWLIYQNRLLQYQGQQLIKLQCQSTSESQDTVPGYISFSSYFLKVQLFKLWSQGTAINQATVLKYTPHSRIWNVWGIYKQKGQHMKIHSTKYYFSPTKYDVPLPYREYRTAYHILWRLFFHRRITHLKTV